MKQTLNIFKVIFLLLVFAGVQVNNDYAIVRLCTGSFADMSGCCYNSGLFANYENHNCSCNHNPQPVKIKEIIAESRIAIPEITDIIAVSLIATGEKTENAFVVLNRYLNNYLIRFGSNYNNRQALTGCFLC